MIHVITCNYKALNPHSIFYSNPKQKAKKDSTHKEFPWGGKSEKSRGEWTASPSITHAPSVSFVALIYFYILSSF